MPVTEPARRDTGSVVHPPHPNAPVHQSPYLVLPAPLARVCLLLPSGSTHSWSSLPEFQPITTPSSLASLLPAPAPPTPAHCQTAAEHLSPGSEWITPTGLRWLPAALRTKPKLLGPTGLSVHPPFQPLGSALPLPQSSSAASRHLHPYSLSEPSNPSALQGWPLLPLWPPRRSSLPSSS